MGYYERIEAREADAAALVAWQEYCDDMAATPACACIRAIKPIDFTQGVARQLLAAIAAKLAESNFKHLDETQNAIERVDDAYELLGEIGK